MLECLSNLVDHIPAAVLVCSADGTIKKYNARAVVLWGRIPTVDDRFTPAYKLYNLPRRNKFATFDCPLARLAILTGISLPNEIIIFEREDGSRVTIAELTNESM